MTTETRFHKLLTASGDQLKKVDAILDGAEQPGGQILADRRLLLFGEVAQIINVSRATVWRMVKDGRLPTVEIRTGTYRVPSQAVTELLNQAKRNGGRQ